MFFLAWPVIKVGVSITFFIFLLLLYSLQSEGKPVHFGLSNLTLRFYLLIWIALASLIFAPWHELQGFNAGDLIIFTQYAYWMFIAMFFAKIYPYLDLPHLNHLIFVGLVVLTINFFFFNINSSVPLLSTYTSRNAYVYNVLALWPFAASHIYHRYKKGWGNIGLLIAFFIMLLTDGRAGVAVIFFENLLLFSIYNVKRLKYVRVLILVLAPFLLLFKDDMNFDATRKSIGSAVAPYSKRVGDFVSGEGVDGDLSIDKSWLTRKLMIEKGMEIIKKHPLLGVGIGHFSSYKSSLKNLYGEEFSRLTGGLYDEDYYNKKSAHNSYIHVLSEMGWLGFLVVVWILWIPLQKALLLFLRNKLNASHISYVALVGICIHFYTITSLTGTVTWVVVGLATGRSLLKQARL